MFADSLRGTDALNGIYAAVLNTARTPDESRRLLQAVNRTNEGWLNDFVDGVSNRDAWTLFTMFSGDVGFAAEVSRKLLDEDYEGAAQDLMAAVLIARIGAVGGQIIGKLRKPASELFDNSLDGIAQKALFESGGLHLPDGRALMNFSTLTSDQKRVIGETFGPNAVRNLLPDGQQIARAQGTGTNGIDDLFKVNRPDIDYVNVEYKFVGDYGRDGAQRLASTSDGLQGSTSWVMGSNRLPKAVGTDEAFAVEQAIRNNRFESWVVTVRPDGSTEIQVLDAAGKVKNFDASKLITPLATNAGGAP